MKNKLLFCWIIVIISVTYFFTSCNHSDDKFYTEKYIGNVKTFIERQPTLSGFLEPVEKEYQSLNEDLKYLDSAKNLQIDFIAMWHMGGNDNNTSKIIRCQTIIDSIITNHKYDIIGSENFVGAVQNEVDVVLELKKQLAYYTAPLGVDTTSLTSGWDWNKQIQDSKFKAFEINRILRKDTSAKIIGVEPPYLWSLQLLLQQSETTESSVNETLMCLVHMRSEIALAKMARYLIQNNQKQKKAVIVYGFLHQDQFKDLAKKYECQSKFYNPCH